MAISELEARLRYLKDSAHLLAVPAPATSRYMMSKCNSLMFENEIEQPVTQNRTACTACGTIMILGLEGTVEVRSQTSKKKKSRSKDILSKEKAMVYTCGSCSRKTRHHLEPPRPVIRHNKRTSTSISKPAAAPSPAMPTINPSSTSSVNATSKKRAKTRKLGGLGALLASKKALESRPSGFGLDLMDLMKKP